MDHPNGHPETKAALIKLDTAAGVITIGRPLEIQCACGRKLLTIGCTACSTRVATLEIPTGAPLVAEGPIHWVDIDSLTEYQMRDVYHMDTGSYEAMCEQMRTHGFGDPIIVEHGTRRIIVGEHRWRAAKKLGITDIPVVYRTLEGVKHERDSAGGETGSTAEGPRQD